MLNDCSRSMVHTRLKLQKGAARSHTNRIVTPPGLGTLLWPYVVMMRIWVR